MAASSQNYGSFLVDLGDAETFMEIDNAEDLLASLFLPFDDEVQEEKPDTAASEPTADTERHTENDEQTTTSPASRFPQLDEAELEELVLESGSKATQKITKYGVSIFKKWLGERGLSPDFENLPCEELDEVLRRFYAEIRNQNGEAYSKSSFVGIRAALSRHMKSPPHNKTFSLMGNRDFHKSNQMFSAVLKNLKKDGLDKTKHYQPISNNDLEKLRESDVLSGKDPKSLQRKIWFDISLNFARRGRENLKTLQKDCFVFKKDDVGVEYCQMAYNESTKNHKGDNLKDDDYSTCPRMYENSGGSCPIKSLKEYLSKLNNDSPHLFQQAKRSVGPTDSTWYTSRPIGERTLNDFMKQISNEAELSQVYTNHCVRATAITLLAHAGVETREIMKISGHRSETSVSSYNADSSDKQKRHYSAILQGGQNVPHPPENLAVCDSTVACAKNSPTGLESISASYSTNTQINQRIVQLPPVHGGYQKQFEIHNSVVNVHNHYGSHYGGPNLPN